MTVIVIYKGRDNKWQITNHYKRLITIVPKVTLNSRINHSHVRKFYRITYSRVYNLVWT